jgi:hypothetical protein
MACSMRQSEGMERREDFHMLLTEGAMKEQQEEQAAGVGDAAECVGHGTRPAPQPAPRAPAQ